LLVKFEFSVHAANVDPDGVYFYNDTSGLWIDFYLVAPSLPQVERDHLRNESEYETVTVAFQSDVGGAGKCLNFRGLGKFLWNFGLDFWSFV
jgi:hypothetical protein